MTLSRIIRWLSLSVLFSLSASPAFAETIELVTYYPANTTTGNLHADSLTVGDLYRGVNPGNGVALISIGLWLGAGFAGTPPPAGEVLHVAGRVGFGNAGLGAPTAEGTQSAGDKLVMWNAAAAPAGPYKASIGLNANDELWLQSSGNNANNKITFHTSNNTTVPSERMRIDSAGSVGIGTPNPAGRLHVQGTDDAASIVAFTPGVDNAGVPGVPQIRVGIGTAAPNASSILDLSINPLAPQGFLPPRMTTIQRNAIPAPAAGLTIFNTDTGLPDFFNGVRWSSSGTVIQVVAKTVSGSSTTSASPAFVAAGTAVAPQTAFITITPRSTNSTLLVEVSFEAMVNLAFAPGPPPQTEYNTTGNFQIYETTGAPTARSDRYRVAARLRNFSAIAIAPAIIRVAIQQTPASPAVRSFRLYYSRTCVISTTVDANSIVYTVTEIQN